MQKVRTEFLDFYKSLTLSHVAKNIITCRLTGTTGPGVDAHISPEKFYKWFFESNGNYNAVSAIIAQRLAAF